MDIKVLSTDNVKSILDSSVLYLLTIHSTVMDVRKHMHLYVCCCLLVSFNVVIQWLMANRGKPTRPSVFNVLIRTHGTEWWSACSSTVKLAQSPVGIKPKPSEPKLETFITEPISLTHVCWMNNHFNAIRYQKTLCVSKWWTNINAILIM